MEITVNSIEYDRSIESSNSTLLRYEEFSYICKSSVLSGKNFIFAHLECIKDLFILKLHVLVKNIDIELSSDIVRLQTSDQLDEQTIVKPDSDYTYFDHAMDPRLTLVLLSCTGQDHAMYETFA